MLVQKNISGTKYLVMSEQTTVIYEFVSDSEVKVIKNPEFSEVKKILWLIESTREELINKLQIPLF